MRIRQCSGSLITGLFIMLITFATPASEPAATSFVTIPLGVNGGLTEDNLSAYLLAPKGDLNFIALDAGTLLAGLRQARIQESFVEIPVPSDSALTLEGWVLKNQIKAYLISHAHIDHIAGLVLNAPDDSAKPIFGLASTIDYLRDSLFNWKIWPNFGDEGETPLKKYQYVRLTPNEPTPIPNTAMTVTAFPLSHSNYTSTAFLIRAADVYALYFGDTGPDAVEKSTAMQEVWTAVAPLVREQKLKGMFLEVSYPDGRPDNLLFGHLTPSWMIAELKRLAELTDPQHPTTALAELTVIVTHIKPVLERGQAPADKIRKELEQLNTLGVTFILPEQGERIEF